tara:strand:- start:706 stop:1062 length:357 start_codon:yes stop_codon:yes gene_type:complete
MTTENKTSVLDNAKSHFRGALSQELLQVDVPEWKTKVYFKVATNFAVEQKIIDLHGKGQLVEALVETLIAKACDKEGKKMFTPADKIVFLREVDPEIIIRVVTEMNDKRAEAKEALGN